MTVFIISRTRQEIEVRTIEANTEAEAIQLAMDDRDELNWQADNPQDSKKWDSYYAEKEELADG